MSVLPVITGKNQDFTAEEAADFLCQTRISNDGIISVPPCHPKAGEVYLYRSGSNRYDSEFLSISV